MQAEGGEHGAAAFQPVVGRAVELYQFAFTSGSQATLAMSGSASFSGRSQTGLAQKTAEGLAAEGKALDLAKFFAKVVIIEAGVGGAGQAKDGLADAAGQTAGAGPAAVGVRQSRLFLFPETFLDA